MICVSIAENSVKPKLALVRFCNGVSDISSAMLSCSVMLFVLLNELLIYYLSHFAVLVDAVGCEF